MSRFLAGFLACAAGAGCAGPGADGLYRWESDAVQQQQEALLASPLRIDDARLQRYLDGLVCRLDADACDAVSVVVIDDAAMQVDLVGNRLLRLRRGMFALARDADALAFALAHELAHRRLGHVTRRRGRGWDAAQAERTADAAAVRMLSVAGFDPAAGVRLLSAALAARPELGPALAPRIEALRGMRIDAAPVNPSRAGQFDDAAGPYLGSGAGPATPVRRTERASQHEAHPPR